jgi:hypothetical protein
MVIVREKSNNSPHGAIGSAFDKSMDLDIR